MTREEFYERYGDVQVKFSNYFKYTFSYRAELKDGSILTCDYGGNSDEIYRHSVSVLETIKINALQPYAGSVLKDGIIMDSFYDY